MGKKKNIDCSYVVKIYKDEGYTIYAEYHKVITSGNERVLGPGKPFTEKMARSIMSFGIQESNSKDLKLFNNNILFSGNYNGIHYLSWWEKSHKRKLLIQGRKTREYNVPSLVYVLKNRDTFLVFAIKGDRRPTLVTKLCNPPFANTYSHVNKSNVCFGTSKIELKIDANNMDLIEHYMHYWWYSEFTGIHPLLDDSKNMLKFPSAVLKPNGHILKDLFK